MNQKSSTFDLSTFTSEEEEALAYASHGALARRDFSAYCTFIDPTYERSPHIDLLHNYLEQIEAGRIRRLMVIMPPGHSKSETASGKFPGWFIARNPTRRVILTSYGATLAETFSGQNRDTFAHNPHFHYAFPSVTVSSTTRSSDKWAVHGQRESMVAGGVGGAITGYRAHGLIVDDPVKNYEEAHSLAHQEMTFNWYKTTSRTRLFEDGWIILIMTHWAKGDLSGRIRESSEVGDWTILHLPALSYGSPSDYPSAKEYADFPIEAFPDPLGRPKGQPLWAVKFGKDFLLKSKTVMQDEFEALYQGNPGLPGGSKFRKDHFRAITQAQLDALAIKRKAWCRSWDLAWSSKTDSDYTVGLKASLYIITHLDDSALMPEGKVHPSEKGIPNCFIVIEDLTRYQREWEFSAPEIKRMALTDTAKVEILVEAVASQNSGFKSLRRAAALWRHAILPIKPTADKVARAQYTTALGGLGMLFILQPSPDVAPEWAKPFLTELADFPHGTNDDQVDSLTQVVNHWQPVIDGFLQDVVFGVWKPNEQPQQLISNLPFPFRENPGSSPLRDEFAWVQ